MKKILIFIASFFLSVIAANADEQRKVKLDDEHSKDTIHFSYCNLFVKVVEIDDDDNAKVTIDIENLDESNVIILFGHAYPEKELKRLSPSITFDKKFPGTKGQRNIDTYREARNVVFIDPSEKITLPKIQTKGGEVQICRFPLYFAKYKGSSGKKLLLLEKQIIELEIEVEVKPDEDFIRLDKESNDLIEKISKQTFCTNPKHKVSLEKQEASYRDSINILISEIERILDSFYQTDKKYKKYNEIKQKLEEVDFSRYEGDCENPKNHISPRRHSCKYCNLSLQQIFHKLEDYYKKIYTRKATKDAVMTDVNLLYRCCTDTNCTKHSSWNKSEYKAKITNYYNRICNF